MRVSALLWPFPFGVRLGWATSSIANPDRRHARGRVYLLRGNGTVFSRGFGRLCGQLRRAGFWAEDLRCVGDLWMRRQLLADHAAGRLRGPLIFVGHSCGGRYALWSAGQLAQAGIAIDLLVCVDVAVPYEVAGNVRHAVHLYRTRRRLYRARPLCRAPGSEAIVDNIDLDSDNSPIKPTGLHHLNITTSHELQAWVVRRVLEAARPINAC